METFVIKVPEDKTALVKRLLKELGVSVRKDTKATTKGDVRLSDKYRNIFSEKDAESFNHHTQNMRNEWPDT